MSRTRTIGPVLKEAKISATTMRMWEREGLIPPPDRSSDGRRLYSEEQAAFIRDFAQRRREKNRRRIDE